MIGNAKTVPEEKKTNRRGFLRYIAGAAALAAVAAAGYYGLRPLPTPAPTTSAIPTGTLSPVTVSASDTEIRTGLTVTSEAFGNGERIPSKYTCDGKDASPPISWTGAPKETECYALIMDDLDAPMGTFTHWLIFNIPPTESGLQEDLSTVGTLPNGAMQGRNDFGKIGYGGPCPPPGTHHYMFHLYALDMLLNIQSGAAKEDVLEAMKGHILAEGQLTGLYGRG